MWKSQYLKEENVLIHLCELNSHNTLLLHSLAESPQRSGVFIDVRPKHCPVDPRDDVLHPLSGCARAEVHVLKDDRKDELPVVVCSVQLTLAVVRVDVLVCDDRNDAAAVLQSLPNGAVPVTASNDVFSIQPDAQPGCMQREQ